MIVSAIMRAHSAELQPPAEAGKVVLSAIGRGESPIAAHALSIKMLLEGEEYYLIDGRTYRLSPGHMLVVDAGVPLLAYNRSSSESRGLCIHFPTTERSGLHFDTDEFPRVVLRTAELDPYGRALQRQARDLHRDPDGLSGAASSILQNGNALLRSSRMAVGAEMNGLPFAKARTKRDVLNRLETARSFLHANAHRPVSLGELALEANLAPFYLNRCFAWSFGVTPIRYHRTLRLRLAQTLLASGQSPSEVAGAIGYGELSSFSHAFKREFGHSPIHETECKSVSA